MKNKKNICLKAVSVISAVSLCIGMTAGCGNKNADKDENGKTILSVGNYPTKEGASKDIWDDKWQRYEAENPDVKIVPDTWEFDLKTFYAKQAGGKLPNLFISHFTEISQYMDIGCVANLTDVLKKRGYNGKFNPKILDIVSDEKGNIYAFPTSAYLFGVIINTDLFEAAGLMEADGTPKQPKDWYELAEFAAKIKEATGKPGIVFPSAQNNGGWIFSCLAWSFGTEFMKQDSDGKWQATFNTQETQDALQYVKDLKWKYDVLPSNTLIDAAEYYKTFGTGSAAMMVGSGGSVRQFVKYGMQPDSIGVIALPQGPKRWVTLLGGELYAVSDNSTQDQIDAAIRWLEMSYNYNATDDFKESKKAEIEKAKNENQLIGIKMIKPWSEETESVKYEYQLIDEYANGNPNHVKLYNDFVADCPADIQPEEPICAQELYSILDGCIQEVLTNENADCAAILEKANADFQHNYLDNLSY